MALNRNSDTWLTLNRLINGQIEKLRADMEQLGMDPIQTEGIRGQIAGLRWVKKTVEPDPRITEETGTNYHTPGGYDPT